MMQPPPKKIKAEEMEGSTSRSPYETFANDCITFRIVRTPEDVQESTPGFKPEFTHQVFADETIYGYRGLKIDVYLHAVTFHAYINITFTDKARASLMGSGKKPDDLEALLKEAFPAGFQLNKQEFLQTIPHLNAARLPDMEVVSQGHTDSPGTSWSVLRFHLAAKTATGQLVRQWHARMQPLVLFFIDGSCAIDSEDDNWDMYVMMSKDATGTPAIAGYCTVYKFYGYPDSTRLRISQVLLTPPWQRKGLGTALIEVREERRWSNLKLDSQ
eukprot:gene4065-5039_t